MQPSAKWWSRRPRGRVAGLAAVAVLLAAVGSVLGVTAMVRLPAQGTICNATTAAAEIFPALVAIGAPGSRPTATGTVIRGNGVVLAGAAGLPGDAATGVLVTLSDGERLPGRLLGIDAATGLAAVKVERQRLPFLLLSPREPVTSGLPVVALGSPLLADSAVLAGTVQAVGVEEVGTDLAGMDGNTGAPVVTCDSRMIGVVVGRASDGTAVVVPAGRAERVVAGLLGIG